MRFSIILATTVLAPLVAAHGDIPGAPKIFGLGRGDIGKLKNRNILGGHAARHAHLPQQGPALHARQGGQNGRCGPDFGCSSCSEGYCCSSAGWCGPAGNPDFCQAPDSLFSYGPGADANLFPTGGSTRNVARPQLGSVEYGGAGIFECKKAGTVAITYDDGPYVYTKDMIDLFNAKGFQATFFITGVNLAKGRIDDPTKPWVEVIQKMLAGGHQIASHTWSHQDLSAITKEQRYDQMIKNEMAFTNIFGKFPTYMRPPYSSCTAASGCQQDMVDLGYVVSYFDLDSTDYLNTTPDLVNNAKTVVHDALVNTPAASNQFLGIAHDIHFQTATNLTAYWLDLLVANGYRSVTMGECLNDPAENWYRTPTERVATASVFTAPALCTVSPTASVSSSAATATPTGVSVDAVCSSNGKGCLGFIGNDGSPNECCSSANWCGNTADHCGTGCQSAFGKCGIFSSSSSSSKAASSTSSRSLSSSRTSSATRSSSVISSSSSRTSSASRSSTASLSSSSRTSSVSSSASQSSSVSSSKTSSSSKISSASSSKTSLASSTRASSSTSSSSAPRASSSSTRISSTAFVTSTRTYSSSAAATPSGVTSPDGSCGGTKKYTCTGYYEGECCSQYGWCGSSTNHCGTTCNPLYGKCTSSGSSSSTKAASSATIGQASSSTARAASSSIVSAASSSPARAASSSTARPSSTRVSSSAAAGATGKVSPDGTCGASKGYTCVGYYEGECCSRYGWCGSSSGYCRVSSGCNALYGKCT